MSQDISASECGDVAHASEQVLEVADLQRDIRRQAGAFFAMGWLALHELTISTKTPERERAMARLLLDRYDEACRALVESLPALEDESGKPTGPFAIDRFNIFADFPMFKNLDLSRRAHEANTWDAAIAVEDELKGLGKYLSERVWLNPITGREEPLYDVEEYASGEANCGMHFQLISEEIFAAGLLYLGRNSGKFKVRNRMTGEEFEVNKRSEFIVNYKELKPEFAEMFVRMVNRSKRNPSSTLRLTDRHFGLMDELIGDRHDAIKPVYTRVYIYRDRCDLPTPLVEPGELSHYPLTAKAALSVRSE